MMARLAEDAGFKAAYVSGGSLGWLKCVTEANLTLQFVCWRNWRWKCAPLQPHPPGAGRRRRHWGDPVHMHHTMALAEAAGYSALEVEDQFLPRRVHHHIGEERLIEPEAMALKIRELVAARKNPDTIIVGRTNAIRSHGLDEALRRAEIYKKAGADMIFRPHPRPRSRCAKIGESACPRP